MLERSQCSHVSTLFSHCQNHPENQSRRLLRSASGARLAHPALVPDDQQTTVQRKAPENTHSGGYAQMANKTTPPVPNDKQVLPVVHQDLRHIWEALGLPGSIWKTLSASWSTATKKQYATAARKWASYTSKTGASPIKTTINQCLEFLQGLLDTGVGYG